MACLRKEGNVKQIRFINLSEFRTNSLGTVLNSKSGVPYIMRMSESSLVVDVIESFAEIEKQR